LIDLQGRVAIVTGAGGGLGRSHARLLAQRGARVVVNDLGEGAETVAREIVDAGGQAWAAQGSVADAGRMQAIVDDTLNAWGRVDILVNNAGILRDKTFAKMSLDDFKLVVDVHLMGAVNCTKAVWDAMREQNYGRIVMTTSSSGLYGNFGHTDDGGYPSGRAACDVAAGAGQPGRAGAGLGRRADPGDRLRWRRRLRDRKHHPVGRHLHR